MARTRKIPRISALLACFAAAGCASAAPTTHDPAPAPAPGRPVRRGALSWTVDLFDVGTGLALLVRGPDFSLVYDGGSNDDRALGPANRLVAYLQRRLGVSGPKRCHGPDPLAAGHVPHAANEGAELRLDHVVLSHPHRDHVALLPDVIGCYAVAHVWDSGMESHGQAYRAFLNAVSREAGLTYHTARPPSRTGRVRTRDDEFEMPAWRRFGELTVIPLGREAKATVLHARHDVRDPNDASVVLRLDVGRTSVLLTGDATAGSRGRPEDEPERGSIEHHLLARHAARLDVDILQVAHHGSSTSSRRRFLEAVSPKWALIGAGPMRYGDVTLPDAEVVAELERQGARVLRTDEDDDACAADGGKTGTVRDGRPGGCTSFRLRVDALGGVALEGERRSE